jgi:hypothetical protein
VRCAANGSHVTCRLVRVTCSPRTSDGGGRRRPAQVGRAGRRLGSADRPRTSAWLRVDTDSHQALLRDPHHAVADAGGYTAIAIPFGDTSLTITDTAATTADTMGGAVLRVADCHLVENAEDHFVNVQRRVWADTRVLGGVVARLDVHHYLPRRHVASLTPKPTAGTPTPPDCVPTPT